MARRRPKGLARPAIDSSCQDTLDDPPLKEMQKKKEPQAAPFFENQVLTPMKIFASDKLDSSSSDVCEVEWDARSPITMSQVARYKTQSVDTSELVKNYTEGRPPQSCTPPLLGLWRDHSDSDDGASVTRYRAQRLQRGRGRRSRGRPSGVKASVSSKEMFLQLESVLETRPDEDEPLPMQFENQHRKSPRVAAHSSSSSSACPSDHSFELFESEEPPLTSTQNILPQHETVKMMHLLAPSPIQKTSKSPLREKLIRKNGTAENLTPKRLTPGSERLRNPSLQKDLNLSADDIWSDEDLFDDSFIIKATQGGFNTVTPPRTLKRKTPQSSPEVTSANKCGRYTFTIGSSTKDRKALSDTSIVGVVQDRVDPQLPYRSYYNRSIKSPLSKTTTDAQQPQNPKAAKEFKFIKPLTCKSPLAVTGPRQSVRTTGSRQPPTGTLSTQRANNAALMSGNNKAVPSLYTVNTNRPNSNLSTKCQSKTLGNQSTVLPVNLGHPALPANSKFKNKLLGRVQGIEPILNPQAQTQRRGMDKPVRHSTPQRRVGVVAMDTSLTDDLLASLAEPDDLLDSQMAGSELLDSQTYREVLSLSPPEPGGRGTEPVAWSTELADRGAEPADRGTELNAAEGKGLHIKKKVQTVTAETEEQIPDEMFDDFMDEDEALSEQQLLAMLEIVESQASQESRPCQTKFTAAVSDITVPVTDDRRKNTDDRPKPGAMILPVKREQVLPRGATLLPVINSEPITRQTSHMGTSTVKLEPNAVTPHSLNIRKSPTPGTSSGSIGSNSYSSQPQSNEGDPKQTQSASQKYTKEDIERKKQEALKKRQNRLKLGVRLQ